MRKPCRVFVNYISTRGHCGLTVHLSNLLSISLPRKQTAWEWFWCLPRRNPIWKRTDVDSFSSLANSSVVKFAKLSQWKINMQYIICMCPNCTITVNHIFMLSLNLEAACYYFFLFPGCDEINNFKIRFKDVSQGGRKMLGNCVWKISFVINSLVEF